MTMNRHEMYSPKDRIQGYTNASSPISLATALRLNRGENIHSNVKNLYLTSTVSCHDFRQKREHPSKSYMMQTRIEGLKKRALPKSTTKMNGNPVDSWEMFRKRIYALADTTSSPMVSDNRYRTIHTRKAIMHQKKQARLTGLQHHANVAAEAHTVDESGLRTIHPKKMVLLAKRRQRLTGLRQHGSMTTIQQTIKSRKDKHLYNTYHPSNLQSRAVLGTDKDKLVRQQLEMQEDMIKMQGKGLSKKYQLIHGGLGKLLRSTSYGSPCHSPSDSPSRTAAWSA